MVLHDIALWQSRYAVNGIFLDEMAYTDGYVDYYADIARSALRMGTASIVGNPGVETRPAYLETVDTIVIREAPGLPTPAQLGGWHGRRHFAFISFGVSRLDPAQIRRLIPFAAEIYVLDEQSADPTFCCIPAYFDDLLGVLDPSRH